MVIRKCVDGFCSAVITLFEVLHDKKDVKSLQPFLDASYKLRHVNGINRVATVLVFSI